MGRFVLCPVGLAGWVGDGMCVLKGNEANEPVAYRMRQLLIKKAGVLPAGNQK